MLLQYQIDNLEKLRSATNSSTNLTIVGKKSSGRKYIIEHWSKSVRNPLIINLERTGLNCEYAALVSVLRKICQIGKNKIVISPNIGFTVSVYTFGFSLSTNNDNILNSIRVIKKCLNKLANKFTLIFIIDNSLDISDQSIDLIDNFILKYKKKNPIYRFTLSTQPILESTNIFFESLTNCNLDKYETLKKLNLNPDIQLNNKVVEFIFQNVSDNIGLLVDIVKDINNHSLDSNFEKFDVNNITENLLNESFQEYKYSSLLGELLTFYAITHYYFQKIDLAFLLNQDEYIVNKLIDFALEHYLIENKSKSYQIIFGLVKKYLKIQMK